MDISDAQRLILGFPQQMSAAMSSGNEDMDRARWGSVGQIGLALLGASGRMPKGARNAALAQGLSQVQDPQSVAMNYAQQRLMQNFQQAKMAELQRQQAMQERLKNDPAFAAKLGISPEQAAMINASDVSDVIKANLSRDPRDARLKDAQIAAMQRRDDPKWGQIGVNADGQPQYGYIPAWSGEGPAPAPIGMPAPGGSPAVSPTAGGPTPEGVNVPEYRKKLADEQAKLKAVEIAKKRAEQEDYVPAFDDYVSTFEKAAKAGAIGPVQANSLSRSIFANTENENLRQQVEAAQNRWAYAQALRTYGKLDRGFTDTELKAFQQQGVPLYSADPTSALEAFKKRFGASPGQQVNATANIPQAAIQHLKDNPTLRDAFDAKFGPGSAAKVLGQ